MWCFHKYYVTYLNWTHIIDDVLFGVGGGGGNYDLLSRVNYQFGNG